MAILQLSFFIDFKLKPKKNNHYFKFIQYGSLTILYKVYNHDNNIKSDFFY